MTIVAALFVSRKGPYWGRPNVDAWDDERDARLYTGPHPVVAHPPCARWCKLARLVESVTSGRLRVGADDGCFASAIRSVRSFGGVLEHPAWSLAWSAHGLITPTAFGWTRTIDGLWVCEVKQSAYGHLARKATWLAYSGSKAPSPMRWSAPATTHQVSGCRIDGKGKRWQGKTTLSGANANATPPAFAEALLELARNANSPSASADRK